MRILPSWSTVINEKVGSMDRIDDGDIQSVSRVDRLPIRQRSASQRINAQLQAGAANGVHVDDILQIANVGQDKIFLVRGRGLDGFFERHALHPYISRAQQFVGAILNPARHVGIGRAAVGRVVLEASVLRRIVRGRNDDAVGEVILAAAVVNQNGSRDDRRRSYTVILAE